MVTARPKGKYTYADYFATPEGEHWELIDGVLYQMAAAPNILHQITAKNLLSRVDVHVSAHDLGLVIPAPFALLLPGESAVEPDLLFVAKERLQIITYRSCEGPPDLVVEILSPSNRSHDLDRKRELYARHHVPVYWMLNTDDETVRALAEPVTITGVGTNRSERIYRSNDTLTTDVIPGLSIPVADIFALPEAMRGITFSTPPREST